MFKTVKICTKGNRKSINELVSSTKESIFEQYIYLQTFYELSKCLRKSCNKCAKSM